MAKDLDAGKPLGRPPKHSAGRRRAVRLTVLAVSVAVLVLAGTVAYVRMSGPEDATLVIDVSPPPSAVHTAAAESSQASPSDQRRFVDVGIVPDLLEDGPYGELPRVAADGRAPRKAYAHPFDGRDDRSRIAVVVADLGFDDGRTNAVIQTLPSAVTLAFNPYADDLTGRVEAARADGHEVMVTLPLEAEAFPYRDPGPRALLTKLAAEQNLDRLAWTLGRFPGYVGAVNLNGDRFRTHANSMGLLYAELERRGLLFLDGMGHNSTVIEPIGSGSTLLVAHADVRIDDTPSRAAINAALQRLETIAHDRAMAVGIAHPYPVTIDQLSTWIASLEDKNLVLAPISAIAGRQISP